MSFRWIVRLSAVAVVTLSVSSTITMGQGGGRGGRAGGPAPAPTRDTSAAQASVGTGAISGAVVIEGGGTPVRRARVTLTGPELRGGRSAITDDQGRFVFSGLPAGRFSLNASKPGFVDIAFGAKRAGRPGTPIQLAENQKFERAVLSMPRGGVITGIVVDEHGEPAPGTPVRALRYVMRTGERSLQQAGQDQTDDRGVYRIFQLQPGEYVVNAVPRNASGNDARQFLAAEIAALAQQVDPTGRGAGPTVFVGGRGGPLVERIAVLEQQLASTEQQRASAYAPVYYPGTTTASGAGAIALGAGEERGGVDFQLQLVPTSRVSGLITSLDGTLPQGTQVALVPADRGGVPNVPGIGTSVTRVGQDGRFAFNDVTPGQYTLQARATIRQVGASDTPPAGRGGRGGPNQGPIAQVLWASTDVAVSGQDLPDLVLNLQPGMSISGRVDFQGSTQMGAQLPTVRVALTPRGQQSFEMGPLPAVQTDASGRFVIQGVAPGRYTITANALAAAPANASGPVGRGRGQAIAAGWSLKSVMLDGQDLLDFPVTIGPNQSLSNVVATFTDRTQELSGTIQDASGRPTSDFTIIVFATDNRFWTPQARRIASARPGTDGKFTVRGLPPGDYRLTAVTDVEPGEWYDPAFLSQVGPSSIPITLADGDRKVQDIRLSGG